MISPAASARLVEVAPSTGGSRPRGGDLVRGSSAHVPSRTRAARSGWRPSAAHRWPGASPGMSRSARDRGLEQRARSSGERSVANAVSTAAYPLGEEGRLLLVRRWRSHLGREVVMGGTHVAPPRAPLRQRWLSKRGPGRVRSRGSPRRLRSAPDRPARCRWRGWRSGDDQRRRRDGEAHASFRVKRAVPARVRQHQCARRRATRSSDCSELVRQTANHYLPSARPRVFERES